MFTGIVRELGRVEALEGGRLRILAPETGADAKPGDSIAVNGVCLTVAEVRDGVLAFDVVAETFARSTLGHLRPGAPLNVEPALRAGEPLGGHIVQGHVDGVGRVRAATDAVLEIEAPPEILRYCVEKGSIAVEGVSLTVAALDERAFTAALVPHTRAATNLGRLAEGDEVNLEIDVIAKYVEKLAVTISP